MAMTIVVTRNATDRVRGFLSSCMCEIAPGIYTSPRMSVSVRERVWRVIAPWTQGVPDCALVMTWPDAAAPGGQAIRSFGTPRVELHIHDGNHLVRRELRELPTETVSSGSGPRAGHKIHRRLPVL